MEFGNLEQVASEPSWVNAVDNLGLKLREGVRAKNQHGKVALVLASTGASTGSMSHVVGPTGQNQLEETIQARENYAKRHGYSFSYYNLNNFTTSLFDVQTAGIYWMKIPVLMDVMSRNPDAEWLWWLDHDALIMDDGLDLYEYLLSDRALMRAQDEAVHITQYAGETIEPANHTIAKGLSPSEVNLVIAQDYNDVNAGSMFFRVSEWSRMLFDMWLDPLFIKAFPDGGREQGALSHLIKHHATIRDHTLVTTQRKINANWPDWKAGDLVVHLAGCWVEHRCASHWVEFNDVKRTGRLPAFDSAGRSVKFPEVLGR